jgi:cytochrome b6-f complex iron-sulfur subunit
VPDDLSRRKLVQRAALLACAPAAARTLAGCAKRVSTDRDLPAGDPVDGVVTVPLASVPELTKLNGAVVLHPQRVAPVLLVTASLGPPPQYIALSALCTHEQCEVAWVPEDREAECPCHGSRFASDGRVVNPPAASDLQSMPAAGDGQGNIFIQVYPGDGMFPDVKNGAVTLTLANYPALQQDGGVVEGRAAGYPFPLIVVRLGGSFKALSAVCPHLGCTVRPVTGGFLCPCHGSQFTLSGAVTQGPSLSDLDTLQIQPSAPGTLVIPLPT